MKNSSLQQQVEQCIDLVKTKKHEYDGIVKVHAEFSVQEEDLLKKRDLAVKSLIALQKVVESKKSETTDKIERLLSYGLKKIFENDTYEFKIISKQLKNQTVYEFRVISDEMELESSSDIMDSRGGGIANIVAFLLRLIILLLTDRTARRFLILDEVFNNLSQDYHENLVLVIREITAKLGFQLLIVTHQDSLMAIGDVVYELRKNSDGVTSAVRLK